VTLDPAWGAPHLEEHINDLMNEAEIGVPVDPVQVIPVADFEQAGAWLEAGVMGRLLDRRQKYMEEVAPISLSELITDEGPATTRETGVELGPYDAQQEARVQLHETHTRVFKRYRQMG